MARQNHGPLSRAKGKLGGVVYQQYEGMQIAREYQPVVKNPQTNLQTQNRAKFKMSSQILSQFKEVLSARFSKLSIYERMRRAASVNAIYNVISTSTPSTPDALVSDVVAAINAKSVSGLMGPELTTGTNAVNIVAANGDTVIYNAAYYDGDSGSLEITESASYISDGTAKQVATFPSNRTVIMAVALHPTTDEGRAAVSNVTSNATGWQNTIARSVAAGDIEVSQLVSIVVNPS